MAGQGHTIKQQQATALDTTVSSTTGPQREGEVQGGPHPPTKSLEENKKDTHTHRERERAGGQRGEGAREERRQNAGREKKRADGRTTDRAEIRDGHWLEEAGDGDFRWVAPLSSLDWVPLDPCRSRGFEVTQV